MKPEHLKIYKELGSQGIADRCLPFIDDNIVRGWKNGVIKKGWRTEHIEDVIDKFIAERAEKRRRLYELHTGYAQYWEENS